MATLSVLAPLALTFIIGHIFGWCSRSLSSYDDGDLLAELRRRKIEKIEIHPNGVTVTHEQNKTMENK